jgi:hypothetical protein
LTDCTPARARPWIRVSEYGHAWLTANAWFLNPS